MLDHDGRPLPGVSLRPLAVLFLVVVVTGIGFVAWSGQPLARALPLGFLSGMGAFVVVGLFYFAIAVGSDRQIWLLRGLFFALVAVAFGASILRGDTVLTAASRGAVIGGLRFATVAVPLSLLVLWIRFERQRDAPGRR